MASNKTAHKRIPIEVYDRVNNLGGMFDVPTTKAFKIQEKFLFGDFKIKNIKQKKDGKKEYEIMFEL